MATVKPEIRNPNGFDLFMPLPELLRKLYLNTEWVVIQSKFATGATGHVFVVRPAKELPTVAKFAPTIWIQQEEYSHNEYVRNKLPNAATIAGQAVYSEDGAWGGLRYNLVGSGQFQIEDLYTYYQHASKSDIERVIERLFNILEPWWQNKTKVESFQFRGSYDRLLPVNLVIQPDRLPQDQSPHILDSALTRPITVGAWVRLEQYLVKKINDRDQVILTPVLPERPYPETYHVALDGIQTIELYRINQILTSSYGQVTKTRTDLLEGLIQEAFVNIEGFLRESGSLTFKGRVLPDPLAQLPEILNKFRDVHVAFVHGDLNLQNILIDRDTGEVNLIDFGSTAQDHILHDFLRLETEVVTKILPLALKGRSDAYAVLFRLYEQLHLLSENPHLEVQESLHKPFAILRRIRRLATRHLYRDRDWVEYYEALAVYLLGALRFSTLESEAKQFAFLTAAMVLYLRNQPLVGNDKFRSEPTKAPSHPLLGNIPPQPSLVIGRESDLEFLRSRVGLGTQEKSALTIVRGWPGVGKSTTVITLAYDPDIAKVFPDGVLWAALGENPNAFSELATWGRALGVEDIGRARTIEEAMARLRAILRNKQMLLIVDDVWQTEHGLPFKVAGEGCATIFTTRFQDVARALADIPGEQVYNLPVLTDEKALELLKTLTPVTVVEHPDESLTLVQDLEGLPLAVQVAGRLLTEEQDMGWGVTNLITELREGAKLLAANAPADRADIVNQTTPTVAALLKKSTDTLSEEIRDHFAFLGAFAPKPATFDLEAMTAVWMVDDPKPSAHVLINRGLLEPVGERYQMHALLVAHARSLLE